MLRRRAEDSETRTMSMSQNRGKMKIDEMTMDPENGRFSTS